MGSVESIYNQDRGLPQDSFLVEMRSLSGYSGSPVFIYTGRMTVGREWFGDIEVEDEPIHELALLGIDWSHLFDKAPVRDGSGHRVEDYLVRANSGMMTVVPAWKLTELLEGDELTEMRKETKREWDDREGVAEPDSAKSEQEPKSFTRDEFLKDLEKATRRKDSPPKP
jgi:hypothetical protein